MGGARRFRLDPRSTGRLPHRPTATACRCGAAAENLRHCEPGCAQNLPSNQVGLQRRRYRSFAWHSRSPALNMPNQMPALRHLISCVGKSPADRHRCNGWRPVATSRTLRRSAGRCGVAQASNNSLCFIATGFVVGNFLRPTTPSDQNAERAYQAARRAQSRPICWGSGCRASGSGAQTCDRSPCVATGERCEGCERLGPPWRFMRARAHAIGGRETFTTFTTFTPTGPPSVKLGRLWTLEESQVAKRTLVAWSRSSAQSLCKRCPRRRSD